MCYTSSSHPRERCRMSYAREYFTGQITGSEEILLCRCCTMILILLVSIMSILNVLPLLMLNCLSFFVCCSILYVKLSYPPPPYAFNTLLSFHHYFSNRIYPFRAAHTRAMNRNKVKQRLSPPRPIENQIFCLAQALAYNVNLFMFLFFSGSFCL